MNLNQLTYFVTLAQIENYTRAAKRLDITQPSLSHAISNLEKELQVPLFERRRFIPELVRGFLDEQEGKKIDFHFQNAATGNLIRGLKEEKFDMIFCSRAEGEKEISFVPVAEEKLVAVVPEDHALAGKNTVTIEELGQYPQVTFTPTSGLYFVVRELFEKEGIVPETAFEVEEDGALAGMVAEGFGVGIVPDVPVIHTLPVKILNIENLHYRRYIYMGMLKKRYPSSLVEQFRDYIFKHYRIYEVIQ